MYYAIEQWIDGKWERTHLYVAQSRSAAMIFAAKDGFVCNARLRLRPYKPTIAELAMLPVRFGASKRV